MSGAKFPGIVFLGRIMLYLQLQLNSSKSQQRMLMISPPLLESFNLSSIIQLRRLVFLLLTSTYQSVRTSSPHRCPQESPSAIERRSPSDVRNRNLPSLSNLLAGGLECWTHMDSQATIQMRHPQEADARTKIDTTS